jgi:hypothetical protein
LIPGIDLVVVFRILKLFKGRFTRNENMESQLYQTSMRIINANSQTQIDGAFGEFAPIGMTAVSKEKATALIDDRNHLAG